jgi:hypothetical protein
MLPILLVVVVVLRRRPFSRWHQQNIEGPLYALLPSIGANCINRRDDNDRRLQMKKSQPGDNLKSTYINKICNIYLMEPLFDHEKLDVYCAELQFTTWNADFLDDVSGSSARHRRELIEVLSLSQPSLSSL